MALKKMIKVEFSKHYLRMRLKLVKRDPLLKQKYDKFIHIFMLDPFYPSLKTHKVNISTFGLVYSSRVTGNIRIIWKYLNRDTIVILTTGGHEGKSSVYK